ncbi:MAG: hypothetical protein R3Y16_06955 [Rikenellaceae bacterium]
MMRVKRYIRFVAVSVAIILLGGVSCARRTMLSDDELAQVFHDAFLSNSYTSLRSIKLDTLKLYEPIFEKYGYTVEDVQYTIGSFSTRKSARLSDVVERAISMLEVRGLELDREVAILDTVDNIAIRRATEVIYTDSLVEYRGESDSTEVKLIFAEIEKGQYYLSFRYLIDSTDNSKKSYTTRLWLERDESKRVEKEVKEGDSLNMKSNYDKYEYITTTKEYNTNNSTLKRSQVGVYNQKINVDDRAQRLIVNLVMPMGKEEDVERSVRIKELKITRVPEAEEARDMLVDELMNLRVFDYELFHTQSQNSL